MRPSASRLALSTLCYHCILSQQRVPKTTNIYTLCTQAATKQPSRQLQHLNKRCKYKTPSYTHTHKWTYIADKTIRNNTTQCTTAMSPGYYCTGCRIIDEWFVPYTKTIMPITLLLSLTPECTTNSRPMCRCSNHLDHGISGVSSHSSATPSINNIMPQAWPLIRCTSA